MNIVDPILFQCILQPKSAALCAPGTGIGLISYGRLAQMIHNICGHATKLGIGPGKNVAVLIKDPIFQAVATLAMARLGVVTVSRYDERILDAVKIDALIADSPPPHAKVDQVVLVDHSWMKGDSSAIEAREISRTAPDDFCRIILTSGTTGGPKAVGFTHRMVADRIARNYIVFGSRLSNCSRIYSDLPLSTASGFRFLIHTLWRGGTFFFPGETFENTIEAFEQYKVQCFMGSPGGVEVLLRKYEQYLSLQSEFEVMIVLGDMFSKSLSSRVRTRICSHVVSVYGATETQTTASAPVELIQNIPGAVGYVVPDVTVEIVSDTGQILPRGSEGLVRIRSTHAVERYIGDPEASAKTFRDGCFYPGDIGSLDSQNLLRIVGRHDALLNLGGDKINPEVIERALAACEGVAECAAFGSPNELGIDYVWAAVVADSEVDDDKLRIYCEANLPPQFRPAGFIRVDRLPRSEMGKLDRRALPDLLSPRSS
jgi:acyl-CoA synthetase (AMP-forming)/AMP-acid ligase II